MKVLLLEDDNLRIKQFKAKLSNHEVDVAHTAEAACALLEVGQYSYIFLDHDLEEEHYNNDVQDETTGLHVAKYLAEHADKSKDARIIIHSLNPVGSMRMHEVLESRNAMRIPFPFLIKNMYEV